MLSLSGYSNCRFEKWIAARFLSVVKAVYQLKLSSIALLNHPGLYSSCSVVSFGSEPQCIYTRFIPVAFLN